MRNSLSCFFLPGCTAAVVLDNRLAEQPPKLFTKPWNGPDGALTTYHLNAVVVIRISATSDFISTCRFKRVPTIDECYMNDQVCKREASVQYFRDRGVEQAIVKLLYQRFQDCVIYEYPDQVIKKIIIHMLF